MWVVPLVKNRECVKAARSTAAVFCTVHTRHLLLDMLPNIGIGHRQHHLSFIEAKPALKLDPEKTKSHAKHAVYATSLLQSNIPTKLSKATKKPVALLLGGAAAVTGKNVGMAVDCVAYPVAVKVPFAALVTWTCTGTVRVTTLDPFLPHAAQYCVMVVCGILGERVGHTVMVVQYVSVTS